MGGIMTSGGSHQNRERMVVIGRRPGFTLFEVITVLVLMGVVAGFVVARNSLSDADLINEAETLKSRLRYAQYLSLAGNDTSRWGVRLNAGAYTLVRVYSGGSQDLTFPQETALGYTLPPASGVTITQVSKAGGDLALPAVISFDQYGRPHDTWGSSGSDNVTITLKQGDSTQTVTLLGVTGFVP
jgi:prepilin-type N-terminal cleavage/methylation domain-containing protein